MYGIIMTAGLSWNSEERREGNGGTDDVEDADKIDNGAVPLTRISTSEKLSTEILYKIRGPTSEVAFIRWELVSLAMFLVLGSVSVRRKPVE
jgi:hypothetical protein